MVNWSAAVKGSSFHHHEPCPGCGSKDNLARYDDGHGYCFGCGYYEKGDGMTTDDDRKPNKKPGLIDFDIQALTARGLSEETCRHWRYGVGTYKGKRVQVANYIVDGQIVAQKIRDRNKDFKFLGDTSHIPLYGQHMFGGNSKSKLTIVEGEIDALSVSQTQGLKWPVVSLPNGARGAVRDITRNMEFVESFDEVILMFDNDDPGNKAAIEVAEKLLPGKAKIARLPEKDANELVKQGRESELIRAFWEAKPYRPDGIRSADEMMEKALETVAHGISWPFPTLTKLTYGRRPGELYFIGAGTGVGKTDVIMETIAHTIETNKERVGLFMLEQPPGETLKRVAGKLSGKRFHIPDDGWSQDELRQELQKISDSELLYLYDHFGSTDWQIIKAKMRYMAIYLGIQHIFLDHLTALAAHAEDERKALEEITAELSGLAQSLGITLYVVSHLATPEGKPHEEGGRVYVRHFKGSRSIGYWGHFIFGLERNQQAEDEDERHTTVLRVLKDRLSGQATGHTINLSYDADTGSITEDERIESDSDASEY